MSYIKGTANYERITGSGGNDTIDGAGGSDIIKTYSGDTAYIFNLGYGQCTLTDINGNDKIVFGDGIFANDLQFFKNGNNLIIRIKDTIDKIDIQNWFDTTKDYKIETLEFNNGTKLTSSQVESKVDYSTKVIIATSENDLIDAPSGNNLIYAMEGNDTITTHNGNNIIEPASGTDYIYNYGNGNDTMYSGLGSHYFEDHGGDDRYIFSNGFQTATIKDIKGNDTIKFDRNIYKEDVSFNKNKNDLIINIKNNSANDKITVLDWFISNNNKIEQLQFNNGTVITSIEIDKLFGQITPPTPNNQFGGITPNVNGTDGNDKLARNNENDLYYAQKGYDSIKDYFGDDTYLFAKSDGWDNITDSQGNDQIIFGTAIAKSDITFAKENNSISISINGTSDGMTITNWLDNAKYKIETIKFQDGTSYTSKDVDNIINGVIPPPNDQNLIMGTSGNDTLNGTSANNTFNGKTGNDNINDPSGDDTYLFNLGDGQDTVTDLGGNDVFKFGVNITKESLKFDKNNNNLIISNKNTTDNITINNWFSNSNNKIEQLQFDNGSIMTSIEIDNLFTTIPPVNQFGGRTPNVIGTDRNDKLTGNNGNDIYYAQKGYDAIKDYFGDDTYLFAKGDGWDNITDTQGNDQIIFGAGITKNDIVFSKNYDNLSVSIKNANDGITINSWFTQSKFQIEKTQLADGSYMTNQDVNLLIQQMTSFSDNKGIDMTDNSQVQSNPELMTMVANAWHN